jgi:hypothetical protein
MDEDADTDGAELAFEALREEVAALRQAVEGQTAPDYALTLGAMAKELHEVSARLTAIEGHPALAMTPAGYSGQLNTAMERAHQAGGKAIWDVQTQLAAAARQLERSAGNIHTREEQQRRIGIALASGVLLGIALWYVLPSLLPWGAGDWLVSSLIGGGRWRAGETLMERASPESFGRMIRLYNACGQQPVESCEAAIIARPATQPGETPVEKPSAARPQSRTGR